MFNKPARVLVPTSLVSNRNNTVHFGKNFNGYCSCFTLELTPRRNQMCTQDHGI